ncbi:MAG: hypothetical protein H6726_19985 [Sandaracinaceae bacterium]|nr:hypothetical protein [Myxococcales bacterium]MCB9659940.1 hypothetical protein [Sandaracinaceae bacterium]
MMVHPWRGSRIALCAMWMACCVVASGCSGCGGSSSLANPDAASDAAASDASGLDTSAPDADTNPFEGADALSCSQLDLAWHQAQDGVAASLLTCDADEDCVLVATSVDCKPVTGEEVEIRGCDTAIAATSEALWSEALAVLAAQLCAERTLSCTSTSLCPTEPMARCVNQRCRVQ